MDWLMLVVAGIFRGCMDNLHESCRKVDSIFLMLSYALTVLPYTSLTESRALPALLLRAL